MTQLDNLARFNHVKDKAQFGGVIYLTADEESALPRRVRQRATLLEAIKARGIPLDGLDFQVPEKGSMYYPPGYSAFPLPYAVISATQRFGDSDLQPPLECWWPLSGKPPPR